MMSSMYYQCEVWRVECGVMERLRRDWNMPLSAFGHFPREGSIIIIRAADTATPLSTLHSLSQRQEAPHGKHRPVSVTGRPSSWASLRPPNFFVKMLSVT